MLAAPSLLLLIACSLLVSTAWAKRVNVNNEDDDTNNSWFLAKYETLEVTTGDSVWFKFNANFHNVVRAKDKASYDACATESTSWIGDQDTTGQYIFTPDTAGTYYFMCTRNNHCAQGNSKVTIVVTEADDGDNNQGGFTINNAQVGDVTYSAALVPGTGRVRVRAVLARDAWLAIGVPGPAGMVGGFAVVHANQQQPSVKSLVSKIGAQIQDVDGGLAGVTVSETKNGNGETVLEIEASKIGELDVLKTETTASLMFAYGVDGSRAFGRHAKSDRHIVSLDFGQDQGPDGNNPDGNNPGENPDDNEGAGQFNDAASGITVSFAIQADGAVAFDFESSNNAGWMALGIAGDAQNAMFRANVIYVNIDDEKIELHTLEDNSRAGPNSNSLIQDLTNGNGNDEVKDLKLVKENGKTTVSFAAKSLNGVAFAAEEGSTSGTLVLATGDLSSGSPANHNAKRSVNVVDFASGGVAAGKLDIKLQLHIALMVISWGVLIPVGVASAVLKRANIGIVDAKWFKRHRAINSSAILLGTVGAILGFLLVQDKQGQHMSIGHHQIGLVVSLFGVFQGVNAVLRPHNPAAGEEKPQARKIWEVVHRGTGSLALILGLANVVIGQGLVLSLGGLASLILALVGVSSVIVVGAIGYAVVNKPKPNRSSLRNSQGHLSSDVDAKFAEAVV